MPQSSPPIYLDNAATSFPKPPEVAETMHRLIREISLSPGRSAHRFSLAASRVIFEARELVADFFGCPDSSRVVFTSNVTEALNVGIFGLLTPGDQVLTTGMEHNSVMRPLRYLEKTRGISLTILPTSPTGGGPRSPGRRDVGVRTGHRPRDRGHCRALGAQGIGGFPLSN